MCGETDGREPGVKDPNEDVGRSLRAVGESSKAIRQEGDVITWQITNRPGGSTETALLGGVYTD